MDKIERAKICATYAKEGCKACYGRGWLKYIVNGARLGDYCSCVKRNMQKENNS